ncbi:MAG: Na+/H+ antiporter NhaC family protein [bacterium]
MQQPQQLHFRGGVYMSALPLLVFFITTAALVMLGAPAVEGMIIAAMFGISVGMLFTKNIAGYNERIFSLMANRIATVAIVCWLWAGAFSGILANSGLVEAMVWIGYKLNLTGAGFTLVVFISSALFAVSVGTGLGTIVGFTAVMYPAGIVLGANPAALMGAIFSGAALGDNLAPISDTTIVSAATQETDVGGVVRSRLKYALIASGIAALLFLIFGGSSSTLPQEQAKKLLAETADPQGLPMLIPAAIVFIVAISGGHFLGALTAGIAAAIIVGPIFGIFSLESVFQLTNEGNVAGSAVQGAIGLLPTAILTLLLVTAIGLLQEGGFLTELMEWLDRSIARTERGTELAIVALVSFVNICVSVNTVAMVATGPMANTLRKRHNIHPHRSANLLDTVSCSFPYILPYAATIVAATAVQQQVAERYAFAQVLTYSQEAGYFFYGIVLFPLMIIAAITGFGRKKG